MAIDFPSNPTNGQTITVGDITYAYDSTKGVWTDNPQGLTQALDALTDVDTSTAAPTNGQVLVYDSASSKFKPGDMSAGVTVYATIDDLPLSGVAEGEMALVDSTDRLYIFSDLGWYNIALVNTSPSISNVASSYALSTDGSATVITIDAADPEGIPLTFSLVSDTSANTATVVQGTGANTNIFTVTPSTNDADEGSFSLTFRASDGVNIASAASSFTLQFSVLNSKYTTALITSVGANLADNNDFVDSSTNSHTITAAGDPTQTTFSPYRHGGYSAYFDGTGDYLHIADNAAFNFGSGDSTIEMWVYPLGTGTFNLITRGTSGYSGFILSSTGFLESTDGASWAVNITFSTAITANSWQHVAVVRNGSTITVYRNGASIGTSSISGSVVSSAQSLTIGQRAGQSNFSGYMTDLRIVKGTPITPIAGGPEDRLTAVTNTSLLACHLPYFADGSTTGHTINVGGDTKIEPFAPYDYTPSYTSGTHGGSIFVGSGDYLDIGGTSDFTFGTGDFTVEAWIYVTDTSNTFKIFNVGGAQAGSFSLYFLTNGKFQLARYGDAAGAGTTTNSYPHNTWLHVRGVRSSGTTKLFINGVEDTGASYAMSSVTATNVAEIGRTWESSADGEGFIADLRVEVGTAISTSDFDPPTAPVSALTNTDLLLSGTNAGIIDKSQSVKTITLNGNVKSSTTQTKYLTSSMYFDGTGDYVEAGDVSLPADFTVEFWIYANAFANWKGIVGIGASATSHLCVRLTSTGAINFWLNTPSNQGSSAGTLSTGTWTHIAFVRSGSGTNNLKLFVDGQLDTQSTSTYSIPEAPMVIGRSYDSYNGEYLNGYLSDVRITKGLARYTAADESANIPTAALQG